MPHFDLLHGIGPRAAWLPRSVEADARLPPNQKAADTSRQNHSRVAYPRSRLQHEASETANRDLNAQAILIDEHKSTVQYVKLTIL
jgi:hypothetical protein